jgi:hypothetical protein
MLLFSGASSFVFCGLLYLPCTVLPESAKVFFGQLSPGYDSIPRGSCVSHSQPEAVRHHWSLVWSASSSCLVL